MKRCTHNPVQFLVREIFLLRFRMLRFIAEEGVGGDDAVGDGFADHGLQPYCEVNHGSRSQMAFGTEMQVIFFNEGKVQCRERNIRYLVLGPDEPLHMVVSVPVSSESFGRAVYPDPFLKVTYELREIAQQGFLPGGHAEQPVLHFLCADPVTHGRQLRIDTKCPCPYLIQTVVYYLRRHNDLSYWLKTSRLLN